MKKKVSILLSAALVASVMTTAGASPGNAPDKGEDFKLGVDVLMEDELELVEGKNVGLITNPTGVDQELNNIVDVLFEHPDVELTALYGPEHGIRGDAQAGEYVESYIDEQTGLPVYSLYGETRQPTEEMLEDVDVLLYDIQDVGTRFYTYIYTMAYVMEAAEEYDIPVVVLDRPNPINGEAVEGPVLDPDFESFVGLYPIPLRHGMTSGELAYFFNEEFDINADLSVVEMEGWERWMYYDDTPLHWVLQSPNMPTLDTALVYPGAALIEGTNASEGRGTTKPFELLGAPFVNSTELAAELNALELPGVTFRAASFTPTISKHQGTLSNGVQIHIEDRDAFQPVETGLHIVQTMLELYPNEFEFLGTNFFDNLIGNSYVRENLLNGVPADEIISKWQDELDDFMDVRADYLLYESNDAPGRSPGSPDHPGRGNNPPGHGN
ncbi:exo-beta-N-acetylmuramidase NamZ domain-containing protein [Bacillus daqingensis]|uniref:Exo-beta-N-acetylmuramidase NamZ domain-containing protein n=1 Tax=Bacillus daqingensis TaxID=872396 RepID=A0ABV9NUF5_9BACI